MGNICCGSRPSDLPRLSDCDALRLLLNSGILLSLFKCTCLLLRFIVLSCDTSNAFVLRLKFCPHGRIFRCYDLILLWNLGILLSLLFGGHSFFKRFRFSSDFGSGSGGISLRLLGFRASFCCSLIFFRLCLGSLFFAKLCFRGNAFLLCLLCSRLSWV